MATGYHYCDTGVARIPLLMSPREVVSRHVIKFYSGVRLPSTDAMWKAEAELLCPGDVIAVCPHVKRDVVLPKQDGEFWMHNVVLEARVWFMSGIEMPLRTAFLSWLIAQAVSIPEKDDPYFQLKK